VRERERGCDKERGGRVEEGEDDRACEGGEEVSMEKERE